METRLRKFKGDRLCTKNRPTLVDLPDDMGDELTEELGGSPCPIPDQTEVNIPITSPDAEEEMVQLPQQPAPAVEPVTTQEPIPGPSTPSSSTQEPMEATPGDGKRRGEVLEN